MKFSTWFLVLVLVLSSFANTANAHGRNGGRRAVAFFAGLLVGAVVSNSSRPTYGYYDSQYSGYGYQPQYQETGYYGGQYQPTYYDQQYYAPQYQQGYYVEEQQCAPTYQRNYDDPYDY